MSGAPALARLQHAFAGALAGEAAGEEALAAHLAGEPSLARRRVALYRRAIEATRRGAMRSAYPVVSRLVGDGFFGEAVRLFGRESPPVDADLNRYGAGFPAFLAAYAPAAGLPWLADVARLEWACHESLMAGDVPALDFESLAGVRDAGQPGLRFELHPGVRLVRSPWPVLAIWEANQPGCDGTPEREEGADDVLVWREQQRVRTSLLAPGEAGVVLRLMQGARLEEAAAAAKDRDFTAVLARLASSGLLVGFAPGAT